MPAEPSHTEQALLQRLAEGDESAFATLNADIRHTISAGQTPSVPAKVSHLRPRRRTFFARPLATAAILILLAGAAAYIWRQYTITAKKQVAATPSAPGNDAPPGHEGAILTIADRQEVVLDSLHDGTVTTQGEATVSIKNGQLAYASREIRGVCGAEFGPLFNTLTTPKGRQYRFTLPDGTQVWLNAASSITYPTVFCGKTRVVTITGEAYFEIAKDPLRPFNIKVNNMEVEVLGTNVDINAYSDEGAIKTTLLEGGVKVKSATSAVMLRPGEQASLTTSAQLKVKTHIKLEEVMAWKNGYFQFNDADIHTVMRQLGRWYNLEVVYEGVVPNEKFGGRLPRNANASEVLKTLEQTQVHFRIEGNKLIVMP